MIPNGFYHQHPIGFTEPPMTSFMQSQMPQQPASVGPQYYMMEPQFVLPPQHQQQQQQYLAPPQNNRVILHDTSMSNSGGKSGDKPILRKPLDGYAIIEKIQIVPLGDRVPLSNQTFINGATTPGSFRLKVYGRTSNSRWEKLGEINYEESGAKELLVTFQEAVKEVEFVGDFMSLSFIVFGAERHRSTAPDSTRASSPDADHRRTLDHGKSDTANRHSSTFGSFRDERGRNRRHSGDKRKPEHDSDDEHERQRETDSKKRRKEEREQRLLTAIRQLQRGTEMRVKTNINSNKSVPLSCLVSSQLYKHMEKSSSARTSSYTLYDLLDDLRNSIRKNLSKSQVPEDTVGKIAAGIVIRLNRVAPQLKDSATELIVSLADDPHHQELTQFCYILLRYTSVPRVDVYGAGSVSMFNDLFRVAVYRLEAILSEDSAGCRLLLSLKVVKWLTLTLTDQACVMAVKLAAFDALLQMLIQPVIMQQFLNDGFLNRIVKYMSTDDNGDLPAAGIKEEDGKSIAGLSSTLAIDKELLMPLYAQLLRMSQLFILYQELNDYAEMFESTCDYAVQRNDIGIAACLLDAMSTTVQNLLHLASLDNADGGSRESGGGAASIGGGDFNGVAVDISSARCLSSYGMLHSIALVMRQMHAFLTETANPIGKIMKAVADAATTSKSGQTSSANANANIGNSGDYDTMGSGGVTAINSGSSSSVVYHDVLAESMRLFVHSVLLFTHRTACKQHHVDTLLLTLFSNANHRAAAAASVNSNNYHCMTEIITCATQLMADRRLFISAVPSAVAVGGGGDAVLHTDDVVVEPQQLQLQIQAASATVPKALMETIRYALNIFTLFDQLAQRLFPPPSLPFSDVEDKAAHRDKADADNDNVIAFEIGADLLRLSYDLRYHTCLLHTLAHPLIIGMFARYFGQAQYSTTPIIPLSQQLLNDNKKTNSNTGSSATTTGGNDNGAAKPSGIPRPPPPVTSNHRDSPSSSSTITTTTTRRLPPARSDSSSSVVLNATKSNVSRQNSASNSSASTKQQFKLSESWQQNPMTILLSDMLHRMLKYVTAYDVNVRYAQLLPSVEQVTQVGALKELTKMLMPYRDFTENATRTYQQSQQRHVERPEQFLRNTCMRMLGVLDRASQLDMIKMPRYSTAICVRLIADCVYAFQAVPPGVSGSSVLPLAQNFLTLNATTAQLESVRVAIQCQAIESLCSAVRANCRYALDKTTTTSYERFESLTAIVAACLQVLKRIVMVVCRLTITSNDAADHADRQQPALPFGYITDIVEATLYAYMLCFYNDDENDVMRVTISRDCTTIFAVLALLASYDSNEMITADDAGVPATVEQQHGFVAFMQCVAERMDAGERGQLPVMQFMRNFFQLLYEAPKRLFAEFSGFFCDKDLYLVVDDSQQKLQRVAQFQHRVRNAVDEHSTEITQVFFGNVCNRIVHAAYSPKLPIAQGIQLDDSIVARKYKTACLLTCTVMLHGSPQLASALFNRLLRELVEAVDTQPRKINVSSAIWSLRQIAMILCSSRNNNALRVIFDDPVAGGMLANANDTKNSDQQKQYTIAPGDTQSMQKFHQFLSKLDQYLRAKALRLLQEQNDTAGGVAPGELHRGSSNVTFASLNDVMQYLRASASERNVGDGETDVVYDASVDAQEEMEARLESTHNGLAVVSEADDVDIDDDAPQRDSESAVETREPLKEAGFRMQH